MWSLHQVVLLGSAPDVAKLAEVQFGELVIRGDRAGAGSDRAVLQRVATATIQAFIRRVADAIVHPAVAPAPGREDRGLSP